LRIILITLGNTGSEISGAEVSTGFWI